MSGISKKFWDGVNKTCKSSEKCWLDSTKKLEKVDIAFESAKKNLTSTDLFEIYSKYETLKREAQVNKNIFEANEISLLKEEQTYADSMKSVLTNVSNKVDEIHEFCELALNNLQLLVSNFSCSFKDLAEDSLVPKFRVRQPMISATFGKPTSSFRHSSFQTPLNLKAEGSLKNAKSWPFSEEESGINSQKTSKRLDYNFPTVQSEIIEDFVEIGLDQKAARSNSILAVEAVVNRKSSTMSKDLVNFSTKRSVDSKLPRHVENPEETSFDSQNSSLFPSRYERIIKTCSAKKSKSTFPSPIKQNPNTFFADNMMI